MNEELLREQYHEQNYERKANGMEPWPSFLAFKRAMERRRQLFEQFKREKA